MLSYHQLSCGSILIFGIEGFFEKRHIALYLFKETVQYMIPYKKVSCRRPYESYMMELATHNISEPLRWKVLNKSLEVVLQWRPAYAYPLNIFHSIDGGLPVKMSQNAVLKLSTYSMKCRCLYFGTLELHLIPRNVYMLFIFVWAKECATGYVKTLCIL